MKGWVYVMSNKAMAGLVKVGYSTKDPELRASELGHAGSPHPYLVEYELLIDDPYGLEQATHKLLSSKLEAKEWFRCSPEEAVAAIKRLAGTRGIVETYKRAERAKAEALHQRELARLKQEEAAQAVEKRLREEQQAIREEYERKIVARFPPRPFWNYWLGASIVALFCGPFLFPKASAGGAVFLAGLVGLIAAPFLQSLRESDAKHTTDYRALEKDRDARLDTVRTRLVSCPQCGLELRFDRAHLLLAIPGQAWKCRACKASVSPPPHL